MNIKIYEISSSLEITCYKDTEEISIINCDNGEEILLEDFEEAEKVAEVIKEIISTGDELNALIEEIDHAHEILNKAGVGKQHWSLAGRVEILANQKNMLTEQAKEMLNYLCLSRKETPEFVLEMVLRIFCAIHQKILILEKRN